MNEAGEIISKATRPDVDEETTLRMYEHMIRLNVCVAREAIGYKTFFSLMEVGDGQYFL